MLLRSWDFSPASQLNSKKTFFQFHLFYFNFLNLFPSWQCTNKRINCQVFLNVTEFLLTEVTGECSIISEVVSRGVRPQTGFYEVLCVTLGCAGVISLSAYILLFSVCLFSAAYLRYASGHHRAGNFPSFRQKHFFFLSFHFCCCQTQSRFPVPTKMELALTIWGGPIKAHFSRRATTT
jgi:hypothetical protein